MKTHPIHKWQIAVLVQNKSCLDKITNQLASKSFSHCELLPIDSLEQLEKKLSEKFDGLIVVYLDKPEQDLLKDVVELRDNLKPSSHIVALLDGDAVKMDIQKIISLNVSDVVDFNNSLWLNAVLSKYFFMSHNSANIIQQASYNLFQSYVNNIHYHFPFGIVRMVIYPSIYVDYLNYEAERMLGYSLQQHQSDADLRNRFLPDERIKLIIENASTGQEYLKKRIKISLEGEKVKWLEAIYIPGFYSNRIYKTIEVILRDVTDEEINKMLQKAVYDVARMTSTNFSLNRIFTIIHKIISDLVNIDNFYIALYEQETETVSFPYFVDSKDNIPPKPRKNGHGLTEYVIKTGKTLLCKPDCFDELLFNKEIEVIGTKPKAWLGVPLKYHGKIIGVLTVQHYTNPEVFSEREKYILEFFSEQVARTIDYKRKADSVNLLSTAVEQSPVSVVITTLKPEIVYVNETFTKVTGYTPKEVIGKNPNIIKSGLTPREQYNQLWDTILAGKTWHGEFINKRKNGDLFYEDTRIVPISDELGKNAYYLAIKIDITENKRLINELIAAKERAEESDKLKTAFLQNISHEIRTPMNAIVGFAELLETDHDEDEKINYYTSVIKQRSYDLLDIINELLDIARIESGQLKAESKPVNLSHLLNDLSDTFVSYSKRMEKIDLEFKKVDIPSDISSNIITDEGKLRQIFSNLIHNAIKFTHSGFIEYGFHELNNGSIVFRVSDTGIGIPEEMQDRIFERFQKSSFDSGVIYDGLGLGLTIVKGLIDLLGGKIWLTSNIGKGTTFYFSIPYQSVENEIIEMKTVVDPSKFKKIHILVVEDDAYNVAYFNELFGSLGVSYHIESTGTDAIEHFSHKQDYDLVLMDIKLPDMTGYEVIEHFKNINPNVPIIAQTAYAAESDRKKALEVGCVDYISKPIFRDKLLELIEKHYVKQ